MADDAQWYVVHTYSGYENTVKATIEKYVENRGLQDLIHEISIPLETVTEITDNGPKDGGAQGLPRLCAGEDGHDRRDAGIWCATSAASPASWAPATRPSP